MYKTKQTTKKGGDRVIVKRMFCLSTAALLAMLILMPAALAQDNHPHLPEPNAVEVGSHEELEQIAGQPVPSQHPGEHPEPVPASPQQGLPQTGGAPLTAILPAAAVLLVGSGVFAYAALKRRSSST